MNFPRYHSWETIFFKLVNNRWKECICKTTNCKRHIDISMDSPINGLYIRKSGRELKSYVPLQLKELI